MRKERLDTIRRVSRKDIHKGGWGGGKLSANDSCSAKADFNAEPAPEYVSISVYERKGEEERAIKRRKRRSYEFWRQKRNVIKKSGKERENGAGRGGGRKKKRKKKKEKEEEEEEKDGKKRERDRGSALAKGIGTGPVEIATNDCV